MRKQNGGVDKILIMLVLGLTLFGILMLANASTIQAQNYFGDKFFYVKSQIVAAVFGISAFFIATVLPTAFWQKILFPVFLICLLALASVFIPGVGVSALGANRWINIAGFNFQPSEPAKLFLILYSASILTDNRRILPFLFFSALTIFLIIIEPDFGTASVILASVLGVFFASGAPLNFIFLLLPILASVGGLLIWTSGYRRERLLTFLGQLSDPLGSSYHISQILIALSSGGLFGLGFGQSRSKYLFLPETATDSIFAVIAEELGFIGAFGVIVVFVLIITRIFGIAIKTRDKFGKLAAAGIGTWFATQTFVNLGAMTAVLPLTGIPLPFISYGGTSLVTALFAVGIVVGISKK